MIDHLGARKPWVDYGSLSTVVGFSGSPTVNIWYRKVGRLVFVNYFISGTSNATNFTFTLPYTHVNLTNLEARSAARVTDNGTAQSGWARLQENTNVVTVYSDWADSGWTSSGTKMASGQFFFEAK